MTAAAHKSENPAATGFNATNQSTDNADSNRLTNLIQGFAKRGHAVYELGNEDFVVTRWGMSRHCPDLAALVAFGRILGVTQ